MPDQTAFDLAVVGPAGGRRWRNAIIAHMDHARAGAFVEQWARAWNAHDVESLLTHFTDDVVFTSPIAIQIVGGDGVIRGKEALRHYWTEGIRRVPDLHFEILAFYAGVHILVVNYRNQKGGLVCEVLDFDGPLVRAGHGTYLGDDPSSSDVTPA